MTKVAFHRRALAWIFRPFSKVEPAEAGLVAIMTLASFLLLSAYYLLKTVREPLILLQGGAEVKLYARAGQALLMAVFVHFYGELARRMGRMKLLAVVFTFFISNLIAFTLLARWTTLQIGLPFFLWVGLFSYTVIAQFWALAADIYTEEQGKRLFPIIGAGSSIGAVAGARLAKSLVPYGPDALMGVAVVILIACVALVVWVGGKKPTAGASARTSVQEEPLTNESALELLLKDRYLLFIGGMVIFLNWVNSSGEYLLDRVLLAAAAAEARATGTSPQVFVGAFKADYFAIYNALGLALQLFAVSRILQRVGVRRALFFMPAFSLLAYGAALFFPVLAVMRLVKIGENGIQYSLQDTTRHALFLAANRAEKFVGKTAIDTVAVRFGAICAALTAFAAARLGWSIGTLAAINVALSTLWIGFVIAIGHEHSRRTNGAASTPAPAEAAAQ